MYHAYLSPDFYNLSAAACGCSLRIRLGCYYEISFVGSDFIRGKTGRIGNSRAGTVNGYNWGGIILMLFHVLASPDRVVRVFLTGAYFGKGREPVSAGKAGIVRPGTTRSFARRSRSVRAACRPAGRRTLRGGTGTPRPSNGCNGVPRTGPSVPKRVPGPRSFARSPA